MGAVSRPTISTGDPETSFREKLIDYVNRMNNAAMTAGNVDSAISAGKELSSTATLTVASSSDDKTITSLKEVINIDTNDGVFTLTMDLNANINVGREWEVNDLGDNCIANNLTITKSGTIKFYGKGLGAGADSIVLDQDGGQIVLRKVDENKIYVKGDFS